jgi:hypothetical protein
MDYIIQDGELYHHGVKGMKWGVRKVVRKRDVKQARAEMKAARHTPEYKAAKAKYNMTKKSYKGLVREYTKEINAGQSFVYRTFGTVTGISKLLAKAHIEIEGPAGD